MKRQMVNLENLRFLAGAATLGFGACLLYQNLAELTAAINGALHGGTEAPKLFAVLFAISQFFWVHAANHQHVLQYLLRHGAAMALPIVLLAFGAGLLPEEDEDRGSEASAAAAEDCGPKKIMSGLSI